MQELGPNQTKWLEALESGNFKQGKLRLRNDRDEYCCLGVACEVLNVPNVGTYDEVYKSYDWQHCYRYGASGEAAYAPVELIDALSLYGKAGTADIDTAILSLTGMNDSEGKSFPEIAAIIRSDPSVYFREPK